MGVGTNSALVHSVGLSQLQIVLRLHLMEPDLK